MSKENELVSIIVPIYNVENYLKKCIDSLMNQTYKNIEIMLIDDGSPDNCGKICDEYAKKDKRILVTHKENGGYGSVLEYGILNMKGEYFIICDSDDWLEPNAIEILYDKIKEKNVDLICGSKYIVYNGKDKKEKCKEVHQNYAIEPNKVYKDLNNFVFLDGTPHAKLYKKQLANKIKFPHKINNTDAILYHVYLLNAKNAIYIDTPLANYFFDRPGNTTTEHIKMERKAIDSAIKMIQSLYEQLDKESNLIGNTIVWMFLTWKDIVLNFPHEKKEDIIVFEKPLIDFIEIFKEYKKNILINMKRCQRSNIKYILQKIYIEALFFKPLTKIMFKIMLKLR